MELKIKKFEEIMENMLTQIDDDIDKEQGSIIWDALAPAAIEMNNLYMLANDIFKLSFVKTSEGSYLTELAFQYGVYRLQATKAVRSAVFKVPVSIGTRFSVLGSNINFVCSEFKHEEVFTDAENESQTRYHYYLECETVGKIGSEIQGQIIPIDYISSLEATTLHKDSIILGEDEEDDESLRKRTLTHITKPEQDGNINQYLKWASEFTGIGNASVIPLSEGPNHVKIIITNADGEEASAELVNKFQEFLDPGENGRGEGKAPIGAIVKVESAQPQPLNIKVQITLNRGFDLIAAKKAIEKATNEYIKKATTQKSFKKYEIASLIDHLKEVDYIVSFAGTDMITLNDGCIFALQTLEVTESGV